MKRALILLILLFLFSLLSFDFSFSQGHTVFSPPAQAHPKPSLPAISNAEDDKHWAENFAFTNFVDTEVPAVASIGRDIYIARGGYIYKYDGSAEAWEIIGIINIGKIYSFYVLNELLYITGSFTQINGEDLSGVAYLEGETFTQIYGGGLSGIIRAIVIGASGKYYIGGSAIKHNGSESNLWVLDLYNWNDWQPLFNFEGAIYSLAEREGKIYIGGKFIDSNNPDIKNIAVYDEDGTEPEPLGSGIDGIVRCIEPGPSGYVYIGGTFAGDSDTLINNIAKLEYDKWIPLSSGVNGNVNSIEFLEDYIIAGGLFDRAGGIEANNLAAWNGNWIDIGKELYGGQVPSVLSMDPYQDGIIVGGTFEKAGNIFANGFAYWNGDGWRDLFDMGTDGVNSAVYDMAVGADNNLYVGGAFDNIGNHHSPGLAMWDGESWSALKQGLQDPGVVYSMVSVENDIYFTGWFPGAYTVTLNNVAKWKIGEQDWEDIGGGIDAGDGELGPIAYSDGQFFVGGRFDSVGAIKSAGIAKWDGSKWMAMGDGMKSAEGSFSVEALEIDQSGMLYCGGRFDSVGTESSMGLGIWSPKQNRWFGLGEFVNGTVYAIAISDPWAYIGGNFTDANGTEVANIFMLNWQTFDIYSLGTGTNGPVYSILEHGGYLFIGGHFTEANGIEANSIVKYNKVSQSFESLGSGIKHGVDAGSVLSLKVFEGKLYVGGYFTSAGGRLSNNIAAWDGLAVSSIKDKSLPAYNSLQAWPNPFSQSTTINYQLSIPGHVELRIFDIMGQEIRTLVNEYKPVGSHSSTWDGKNDLGETVVGEIYFYKMRANDYIRTRKLLLLK